MTHLGLKLDIYCKKLGLLTLGKAWVNPYDQIVWLHDEKLKPTVEQLEQIADNEIEYYKKKMTVKTQPIPVINKEDVEFHEGCLVILNGELCAILNGEVRYIAFK